MSESEANPDYLGERHRLNTLNPGCFRICDLLIISPQSSS